MLGAGGRGRKRKDGAKSMEFVTTDDEAGEASEVEGLMVNGDLDHLPRRQTRKRAAQNGAVSEGEPDATGDENDAAAAPTTPKARREPRPARKRASLEKTQAESPSKSPSPTPARNSMSLTPLSSVRGSAPLEEPEELEEPQSPETPKASRKRGRSEDDEPSDAEMLDVTANGIDDEAGSPSSAKGASQETQASEIQVRRKRVRR